MKHLNCYQNSIQINITDRRGAFAVCKIILLLMMWSGCKKDNLTEEDKLYARLASSSMVSYIEHGSMVSLRGTQYNFVTSYVGVPVTLKTSTSVNDTIFATIDTALVTAYNQLYLENNPSITANAFSVSHNGVFPITAGTTKSKDSLYVTLRDASKLKNNTTYLIPISLASKQGSSLTYSLFFIKMKIYIGELAAKMDMANRWGTSAVPSWSNGRLIIYYTLRFGADGVLTAPDSVRISVGLSSAFKPSNLSVYASIAVDDATINGYSVLSRIAYRALPANTYELRRSVVQIPAGATKSRDSLSIVFKNKQSIVKNTWYLLGLKLKDVSTDLLSAPPVKTDSATTLISIYAY
ncbi:DUF1735 domain-containing protein [Pedobacter sp. AW1-32]|uniref:DUF1735 domain-containing protein n=1 Tax=Pedobacter sp. AW1-32 TaxID=3383026 RepID=UPI003FF102A1